MFRLLQTWKAIHDNHNSGASRMLPPPEWEKWVQFRKTEKSNKTIKEDIKLACTELDAAFLKGKTWLRKRDWLEIAGRLTAMSKALERLQV